jgi:ribosomal protein S6--L-glutamate ligase
MRIAILSRKDSLYSTTKIKEAALARGHTVDVLDYLYCSMRIATRGQNIYYKGEKLGFFDAIIPRIGANRTFYGASVVRQFESLGMYTINSSIAITRSRDKLRCLQLLSEKQIEIPKTSFASHPSTQEIHSLIKGVDGPPVIIKLLEGTQGIGVVLAETSKAAESVMQAFMSLNTNIIVQEFIKESQGCDVRCFVVGDQVVASMLRKAASEEFRSNIHRGGVGEPVELSQLERDTAIRAAKTMGLSLAGVDILRSDRGPLVLEVNSSPGLEGIEKATGINIADLIICHLEKAVTGRKDHE